MKLAFYFSLACTARCAHCITHAGPKVRRKMSLEDALAVVDQVAAVPDFEGIVFTGGENLIHKEEMLTLVTACTRAGLSSEIITNAYWGRTRAQALEMVEPFREAGVGLVRVSIDRYHLPYVKPHAVRTALDVMGELGLRRSMTCVIDVARGEGPAVQRSIAEQVDELATPEQLGARLAETWPRDLHALLGEYGFAQEECFLIDDVLKLERLGHGSLSRELATSRIMVQYQALATEGRGRELLDSTALYSVDELPETVCDTVGSSLTINPEGSMFPCCSAWVNMPGHRLGTTGEIDVGEFLQRARTDPIGMFMHHQGPAVLVRFARQRGHQLPADYSHVCHVCGTLLDSFGREDLLALIEDYYRANPWRMIYTSRGFDLAVSASTPIP